MKRCIPLRPFWRVIGTLSLAFLYVICLGCGDTFRPVAIPIPPQQPDPSSFHFVLVVSDNGDNNPGATSRIDVSGDTNVGIARVGLRPVHAALLPSASRVYVANQAEQTVSWYSPGDVTKVTTVTLPDGYGPTFVHTTQNDSIYVAELKYLPRVNPTDPLIADPAGAGLVSVVSVSGNVVSRTIPVGINPAALAETPDAKKLYVMNQGSGTVTSINTLDGSINAEITPGGSPVWGLARSDSQRIYVLSSDSGTVTTINTSTDQVVGTPAAIGVGADFMIYDKKSNRLYVTNPASNTLTVLDTTQDPATVLMTVPVPASPRSVAALPDGSRIYVASEAPGADPVSPQVTVLNADGTLRSTIPLHSSASNSSCGATRFRLFAVASSDSSRVYVGDCDAGKTAVIRTTPNTTPDNNQSADQLVLDINAPVSSGDSSGGGTPPPQIPVFIVAGP